MAKEIEGQGVPAAGHCATEPSEASLADWVMKMAIHAAIASQQRKDFGGAGGDMGGGPGGRKAGGEAGQRISDGVVCSLSSVRY